MEGFVEGLQKADEPIPDDIGRVELATVSV